MRFSCYGELVPVGHREPTASLRRRLRALVEHALPDADDWCDWRDADVWTGDQPFTPDGLPLVGPARGVDGLWLNVGHGLNGWRESVLTARRVGALIDGEPGPAYADAWAPGRFGS